MSGVLVWLFLSFIVERITEWFVKLFPKLEKIKVGAVNVEMLIAFIVSLLLAFSAKLDMFALFDVSMRFEVVGIIASAIFMSGGSNLVHDVIEWVRTSKKFTQNKLEHIE